MKKRGCFLLMAIGVLAIAYWQIQPQIHFPWFTKKNTFFTSASIHSFSDSKIALIPVELENQKFNAKLDLGFHGDICVPKDILMHILDKRPSEPKTYYGVQGKTYYQESYHSPNFSIGRMLFSGAILTEESKEFFQDSILEAEDDFSSQIAARIGWKLFYNTNLYLDFSTSTIAFCDSFATLKEKIKTKENFVKVPLHMERGILEIDIQTDLGPLRCFLDTGSTWNILNTSNSQVISSNIKINDCDFGTHTFHFVSLKFPFKVDAILGSDFFQKCRVFIDFRNQQIYLSKNNETK